MSRSRAGFPADIKLKTRAEALAVGRTARPPCHALRVRIGFQAWLFQVPETHGPSAGRERPGNALVGAAGTQAGLASHGWAMHFASLWPAVDTMPLTLLSPPFLGLRVASPGAAPCSGVSGATSGHILPAQVRPCRLHGPAQAGSALQPGGLCPGQEDSPGKGTRGKPEGRVP